MTWQHIIYQLIRDENKPPKHRKIVRLTTQTFTAYFADFSPFLLYAQHFLQTLLHCFFLPLFISSVFPSHLPLFLFHVSKGTPFTRALLTSSRIPAMGAKEPLLKVCITCWLYALHVLVSVQRAVLLLDWNERFSDCMLWNNMLPHGWLMFLTKVVVICWVFPSCRWQIFQEKKQINN